MRLLDYKRVNLYKTRAYGIKLSRTGTGVFWVFVLSTGSTERFWRFHRKKKP